MQSIIFEKTLGDVVKGIRASKRDTALYISRCIAEIKREIHSTDLHTKCIALEKLTFLQMMGYGMGYASFASIEVMSSPRFAHKRVGYLAASQGFNQNTEVTLLTTNLLKKELRGANGAGGGMAGVYEAGLAINCLSNIVTEDLARELLPDLTELTSHPQPYLRKKSILCLFKLFVKYPRGLRLTFDRIERCLDDPNPSVVSCAVNVVTELSDKNPKNYLRLAPAFFQLLTSSSNNWMLIKVVKLLGSLVAEEPRLARKLLDPLSNIVKTTQAKSLLYEAVRTITLSLPYCRKSDGSMPSSVPEVVALCATTLRSFLEETDQNLKYLGLVGFASLASSHPRVLSDPESRTLVLACLSDDDVTIRTRALDLLGDMATRKNLPELVEQLLTHVDAARGTYKSDLVTAVVGMCSSDKYVRISDFGWYLDVLVELGRTNGIDELGEVIGSQIVDVALRVLPARSYAVRRSMEILTEDAPANADDAERDGGDGRGGRRHSRRSVLPEVLPAAAWIVGEYSHLIPDAVAARGEGGVLRVRFDATSEGPHHSIVQSLTFPSNINTLPTSAQSVYVQAAAKVASAASDAKSGASSEELDACLDALGRNLPVYMESTDAEVRERSCTIYNLFESLGLLGDGDGIGGGGAPGLTAAADEDEDGDDHESSSSDEEEGTTKAKPPTDTADLLSMAMSSAVAAAAPSSAKGTRPSPSAFLAADNGRDATRAQRCRSASSLLRYLFVPDPMKPIGSKAQRKKRQSPPSFANVDLDAPVDASVVATLLGGDGGDRGIPSIESVNFTGQRVVTVGGGGAGVGGFGGVSAGADAAVAAPSSEDAAASGGFGGGFGDANAGATSFQNAARQQPRQSDPFYLPVGGGGEKDAFASSGSPDVAATAAFGAAAGGGRFGTIQLLDSDDEDEDDAKGKKKRSKGKKKKKKKKGATTASAATADVTVYGSDEDDAPSRPVLKKPSGRAASATRGGVGGGGNVVNGEFEGLARVDLTAPLGEDEVFHRNEHRVVPDRSAAPPPAAAEAESKKKKKKKKEKKEKSTKKEGKKKKEKKKAGGIGGGPIPGGGGGGGATTMDLLDLGGLYAASSTTATASGTSAAPPATGVGGVGMTTTTAAVAAPTMSTGGIDAIGSAFDDLLSLSAPTTTTTAGATQPPPATRPPPSATPPSSSPPTTSKKGKNKLWQNGSIKASSATGRPVDWGNVSLRYRSGHAKVGPDGVASASIALRLINRGGAALTDAVAKLEGHPRDVVLGDVDPGSFAESSSSKIGPFAYGTTSGGETSRDVRGTISASGGSASFKIVLPASAHLRPERGLTQEDVLAKLSSGGGWDSRSVRLDVVETSSGLLDGTKLKSALGSFLKAEEVESGNARPESGTFAARSNGGSEVFFLAKRKGDGNVKVDVKCTDATLGKALASDLKKLVL